MRRLCLARSELSELVESVLQYFNNERYKLLDHVVMPNHVHVIVTPFGEHLLSSIVHTWKSFAAHRINDALNRRGAFWQKESFDHIVRSVESLEKFREYNRGESKM